MGDINETACGLLRSTPGVDLGTVAATDLYTVPAGKICVVHYVVIRLVSGDVKTTVATFGETGAATDFVGAQTLVALNAAGSAGIIMPVPAAATVEIQEYSAAEVFVIDVTTASGDGAGTPTCTVDVYGSLADA